VRRTVLPVMLIALLLGTLGVLPAQADSPKQLKPLAVVSLAGCDAMRADVEFIGKLSGNPNLGKALDAIVTLATKGQGLAGLDKTRPWGVVIQTDGGKPTGYACIPVTDLAPMLRLVNSLGCKVTDEGDGVFKIETKKKPLYVTEKDGWAIVCDDPQRLAQVPAKPARLLRGLSKRYDLAVRLYVSNMPQECRQKLADCLREHAKKRLARRSGGTEQEQTVRKQLARHMVRSINAAINDLDRVTLGWSLDQEAERALLELTITAKEGTKTAECLGQLSEAKTKFGGFRIGGAALSCGVTCNKPVENPELLDAVFEVIQARVAKRIDKKVKAEQKAEVLKKFAAGLLEVARETKQTGKVDGAMSLLLRPNGVTLIGGRYVADADKLEKTFGDLVDAIRKKYPDRVEKVLTPNAEKFEGVRLHRLSITIPEKAKCREKAVKLVGEKLEVVMGIGPECVYLAAGKNATAALKRAIAKSKTLSDKPARPMQLSLDLGTIATFAAAVGKEECRAKAEKALAAMEDVSGDQIRVTVNPINRGVRCRLEIQPAALKALATVRPHHHCKTWGGHDKKGHHGKKGTCPAKKKSPAKK